MPKGRFYNVHGFVDFIINNYIKENWICVDATLGNGYDALKIYRQLGTGGYLYGFDIQSIAVTNSSKLINEKFGNKTNIEFIVDSHENVDNYIKDSIDFFIMNLGYLPGGNKNITTTYMSTKSFLDKSLLKLRRDGLGIIVFYPGHSEGLKELDNIVAYLNNFNQKDYNIMKIDFINQINHPPQLVIIERI